MSESALLNLFVDKGPLVLVLLLVIWYFYKRDQRNEEKGEAREKHCEDRADALQVRIQHLEDTQTGSLLEVLRTCAEALKTNADAFKELSDETTALTRKRAS